MTLLSVFLLVVFVPPEYNVFTDRNLKKEKEAEEELKKRKRVWRKVLIRDKAEEDTGDKTKDRQLRRHYCSPLLCHYYLLLLHHQQTLSATRVFVSWFFFWNKRLLTGALNFSSSSGVSSISSSSYSSAHGTQELRLFPNFELRNSRMATLFYAKASASRKLQMAVYAAQLVKKAANLTQALESIRLLRS